MEVGPAGTVGMGLEAGTVRTAGKLGMELKVETVGTVEAFAMELEAGIVGTVGTVGTKSAWFLFFSITSPSETATK